MASAALRETPQQFDQPLLFALALVLAFVAGLSLPDGTHSDGVGQPALRPESSSVP